MKTTVLGEIKAAKKERLPRHTERKLLLWRVKGKRNLRWVQKRKDDDNARQAEHSREAEEGTQRSSEANRDEFQTERVCVCVCEFVCAARWSVCPDNSICCPLTGLPLRLHS